MKKKSRIEINRKNALTRWIKATPEQREFWSQQRSRIMKAYWDKKRAEKALEGSNE